MRHPAFPIFTGMLCLFLFVLICPSKAALAATDSYYSWESFPIAPGGLVVVEAAFHNVEVKFSSGPDVEVEVRMEITAPSKQNVQRLIDEYTPVFTAKEDLIRIRATHDKYLNFLGPLRLSGTIKLTVPSETNLEIKTASGNCSFHEVYAETITVSTASGNISFSGTVLSFAAHTASGDIRAEFIEPAASVEAHSASGDIQITGPVEKGKLHNISGEIKMHGLHGGTINASTVSGNLSASWEAVTEQTILSAETVSGSIRFFFPEDAKIAGEINTKTGRIEADFPGKYSNKAKFFTLQEQDANVQVTASSVSGSIYLLARGERSFFPKETPKKDETLVDELKSHRPPASPPAAILNLYCYEKMLTPGLKFRLGADVYATGNIEYSYRERDLTLQLGAVYLFPYDSRFLSFYGGGGAQFSTEQGFQCPYIVVGANFFFLFYELVYPWEINMSPRTRFGLKIDF
ncbi:MAG: DUF4097 domain-containing protein [Firmicutes bacterium]|nr:DUF4097 domain-containing protein [Bacillota bacterium]